MPYGVSNHAVGFELEIDPVVESSTTKLLTVGIKCNDKDVQIIVEIALEIIMQSLTKDQVGRIIGTSVDFNLTPLGGINLLSGDEVLASMILNKLAKGLQRIGIEFDRVYTVSVLVKSGEAKLRIKNK